MTKKTFIISLILAIIAQCMLSGVISSKLLSSVVDGIFTTSDDWDGSYELFPGEGTKNNPYEIKTAEQLAYLARAVNGDFGEESAMRYNDVSAHYELCADLDLNGHPWTPIGIGTSFNGEFAEGPDDYYNEFGFHGVFNGKNHKISGLFIDPSTFDRVSPYVGLFGHAAGEIVSLVLEDVSIACYGQYYVGALCGRSDAKISDCTANGVNIDVQYNKAYQEESGICCGGLVGVQSAGEIYRCHTSVNIRSTGSVGGLVGYASRSINKSSSSGEIHYYGIDMAVGGLVGQMNAASLFHVPFDGYESGQSTLSYTSCTVRCMDRLNERVGAIGGFAGRLENCSLSHCYSTGTIGAPASIYDMSTNGIKAAYVGGFFGFAKQSSVLGSYTTSKIYDNYSGYAGEFGGYMAYSDVSTSAALALSYSVDRLSSPFPFDFVSYYFSDAVDPSTVLEDCYFAVENYNDGVPENKLYLTIPITLDDANNADFFKDTLDWINAWDYSDLDLLSGIGPSLEKVK